MSRADAGNFVVMSLFSAAPFPLLSVSVGNAYSFFASSRLFTVSQFEGNEYCECFEGGNNQGGLVRFGEDPRPLFVCDLKGKPRRQLRIDDTTFATTGGPTSDPRTGITCLCINSWCLFRALEEVQNEGDERRNTPH